MAMSHVWICKTCSTKTTVIVHPNGERCPQEEDRLLASAVAHRGTRSLADVAAEFGITVEALADAVARGRGARSWND